MSSLKQLKSYTEDIMDEPHHITVYFDGGFDNQTRAAGLGCAIYFEQNTKKYRKRINTLIQEIGSNNEAEYAALHFGIKELANMGVHHLPVTRSEEHTSELQSRGQLVCRLLLEKKITSTT